MRIVLTRRVRATLRKFTRGECRLRGRDKFAGFLDNQNQD